VITRRVSWLTVQLRCGERDVSKPARSALWSSEVPGARSLELSIFQIES